MTAAPEIDPAWADIVTRFAREDLGWRLRFELPGVGFITNGRLFHLGYDDRLHLERLVWPEGSELYQVGQPTRHVKREVIELTRLPLCGPNAGPYAPSWRRWTGSAYLFRTEDLETLLEAARRERRIP